MNDSAGNELTYTDIIRYLGMLNEELKAKDITGEMAVCGGAAMVLAFQARNSTQDIDALFAPTAEVRDAIANIAARENLPGDWINDGAKGYLNPPVPREPLREFSHLRILRPTDDYLLAMKCCAARVGIGQHDKEDAMFLIRRLKMTTAKEVEDVVAKYFPPEQVPSKTQYFIQDLIDEL